jgi:hypothetical protein
LRQSADTTHPADAAKIAAASRLRGASVSVLVAQNGFGDPAKL